MKWLFLSGSNVSNQISITSIPSQIGGRYGQNMILHPKNDSLYVFGGNGVDSKANLGDFNDLWVFSLYNLEWYSLTGNTTDVNQVGIFSSPGIIRSREDADMVYLPNDSLIIFGGYNNEWLNDVWMISNLRVCNTSQYGLNCSNCTCQYGICYDGILGNGLCLSCNPTSYGINCNNTCSCTSGYCLEGIYGNGSCIVTSSSSSSTPSSSSSTSSSSTPSSSSSTSSSSSSTSTSSTTSTSSSTSSSKSSSLSSSSTSSSSTNASTSSSSSSNSNSMKICNISLVLGLLSFFWLF